MVPVDEAEEAEEAEEESSSGLGSDNGLRLLSPSSPTVSSSMNCGGSGGSEGRPASLALAKDR